MKMIWLRLGKISITEVLLPAVLLTVGIACSRQDTDPWIDEGFGKPEGVEDFMEITWLLGGYSEEEEEYIIREHPNLRLRKPRAKSKSVPRNSTGPRPSDRPAKIQPLSVQHPTRAIGLPNVLVGIRAIRSPHIRRVPLQRRARTVGNKRNHIRLNKSTRIIEIAQRLLVRLACDNPLLVMT